jgi:hypothetical protein
LKRLLIGIDEAGYGPKMGPLIIGASVWLVPEKIECNGLLEALAPEFQCKPWQPACPFLPLGDSKSIYQNVNHLDSLRLAICFLMDVDGLRRPSGTSCHSTSQLIHHVGSEDASRVEHRPWYHPSIENSDWRDLPIPAETLSSAKEKLARLGIEFRGFHCRIVDEGEFNRVIPLAGNKANALGEWSLHLLRECIALHLGTFDSQNPLIVEACCDRQGGRKRYLPLLNHAFHEWSPWFDTIEESNHCSRYRGRFHGIDLRVGFQVGGDSLLPTAAASMLAKLVRELLMRRLNRYWQSQLDNDLKPTAGYPVDAERFRAAIEERAKSLSHSIELYWRCC